MAVIGPLPYYRWHWQDYRANRTVQRMSYIERGLYRELLDECWAEGFIVDDIKTMAEICACPVDVMASAWQALSKCFAPAGENILVNPRMDRERTEKDQERATRAIVGKTGGLAKARNLLASASQNLASANQVLSMSQGVASNCHIEEKRREEKEKEKDAVPAAPEQRESPLPRKKRPGKTLGDYSPEFESASVVWKRLFNETLPLRDSLPVDKVFASSSWGSKSAGWEVWKELRGQAVNGSGHVEERDLLEVINGFASVKLQRAQDGIELNLPLFETMLRKPRLKDALVEVVKNRKVQV